MSPQEMLALVLAVICAYTDARRGLIYNKVTLPAMLFGVAVNLALAGLPGLYKALSGLGIGFAIGVLLVELRVFFPGDLKLFMAFGAITGFRAAWETILLTVILSGIQGIATLIVRGTLGRTVKCLLTYVLLGDKEAKPSLPALGTMPVAPAFLIAAFVVIKGGGA